MADEEGPAGAQRRKRSHVAVAVAAAGAGPSFDRQGKKKSNLRNSATMWYVIPAPASFPRPDMSLQYSTGWGHSRKKDKVEGIYVVAQL